MRSKWLALASGAFRDRRTQTSRLASEAWRTSLCQECVELRLGVPGVCHGEAGMRAGKRYKCLIIKPLAPATTVWKSARRQFDFCPWPPFSSDTYADHRVAQSGDASIPFSFWGGAWDPNGIS
jgi:hypothetical protein